MSNQLTGDFDAVAQVSAATINRLLATMHQNGDDSDLPTLPHRAKLRLGDKPLPAAAAGVRGTAQLQIGTPTLSLVPGVTRDADLSCWIRVRYRADAGTVALPEFIHGRIVARFHVETTIVAGTPSLRATASADDAQINFVDSGLASGDLVKVNAIVRHLLRTYVTAVLPLPAELPQEAADFRVMTDLQNRTALALAITVDGNPPTSGSFGNVFLDSYAFALAAGCDLITAQLQPAIKALNESHPEFTISRKIGWGWFSKTVKAHYTISMSASVTCKGGVLTLKITGTAETPTWWAPNADFTISQDIGLSFDAASQTVIIAPSGQPTVTVNVHGPFGPLVESKAEGNAKDKFVDERDKALPKAQTLLNALIAQQLNRLRTLLRRIDPEADPALATGALLDAGVLLQGTIKLSTRKAPRVEFTELGDGSGYTAYPSWIPGGRIKDFTWTWWRNGDPIDPVTGGPTVHKSTLSDRFVLQQDKLPILSTETPAPSSSPGGSSATAPSGEEEVLAPVKPGLIADPDSGVVAPIWGQACLRITGERIDAVSGQLYWVSEDVAFDPALTCTFHLPLDIDFYTKPKQIIRMGDPDPFQKGINTLILSLGPGDPSASLRTIREAIASSERPGAGLQVVLAARADGESARTLASAAQTHLRSLPRVVAFVVDRGAAWLEPAELPASDDPALRLTNADGRLIWRHEGAIDAGALAAAFRAHLMPAGPQRAGLLRVATAPGARAPDFVCQSTSGRDTALRHFRGRRVALLFAPADVDPLDVLPRRFWGPRQQGEQKLLVIAVQDRVGRWPARDVSFDYLAVPDVQGRVAGMYGIRFRPTLVLIDHDGRISAGTAISAALARP